MSISLTPETQRLIEEKLKQGGYSTVDDLVHAAFYALEELEDEPLDEETAKALDLADAEIERGEVVDWSEARRELRSRYMGK